MKNSLKGVKVKDKNTVNIDDSFEKIDDAIVEVRLKLQELEQIRLEKQNKPCVSEMAEDSCSNKHIPKHTGSSQGEPTVWLQEGQSESNAEVVLSSAEKHLLRTPKALFNADMLSFMGILLSGTFALVLEMTLWRSYQKFPENGTPILWAGLFVALAATWTLWVSLQEAKSVKKVKSVLAANEKKEKQNQFLKKTLSITVLKRSRSQIIKR